MAERRRIETTTSRTAEMTCISRACSAMERNPYYHSGDHIAPLLLPGFFKALLPLAAARWLFSRIAAPHGIYEYVIARTRYIDAAFERALSEGFNQVLILGAGFDTRALRFGDKLGKCMVYELDATPTQQAKIGQYQKRGLSIPDNLKFIPIDFDRETLAGRLRETGFRHQQRSLFVMEGLLMYLQPESVGMTLRVISDFAGGGSRAVFDFVYASVLRGEGLYYGERDIMKTVSAANEQWHFGIEKGQVEPFLAGYGMRLIDQHDAQALEKEYFCDPQGRIVGRVNGTHCLVTAEKK